MVRIMKILCDKLLLVFGMLILISCNSIVDPTDKQNLGIPNYELTFDDEEYGVFIANTFSKLTVVGKLEVDGQSYRVKLKHHGYSSRELFRKNYALEFESATDPYFVRKNIIISGQETDPTMLKSVLSNYLFEQAGLITFQLQPIIFFINGESQGLYFVYEPINEEFFEKRNVKINELYKGVNCNAYLSFTENKEIRNGFEKRFPEDDNYYSLEHFIKLSYFEKGDKFIAHVEKYFNVEKYLSYMALSVLTCSWDGVFHNYYLYQNTQSNKFEIVPWDLDRGFEFENDATAFPGKSDLLNKLLEYPKYKELYKHICLELLDGCFSEKNMTNQIALATETISEAYARDRWLRTHGYNLNNEAEKIIRFVRERHSYMENQLATF